MPVALHALRRSGVISDSEYRKMMADHAGAIGADEINAEPHQTAGARANSLGLPSRGGQARGGTAPNPNAINKPGNKKRWPKQSPVRGKPGMPAPSPHTPVPSRPMYYSNGRG